MADNRYIVTRSNYTIKKKHQLVKDGTIYERDYMTTNIIGGFDSGVIPFGEGNFKFIAPSPEDSKKRHRYGNWLMKDPCNITAVTSCEFFSLNDISPTDYLSQENEIVTKPSKNTLLDYVYFGNCQKMIEVAINDIIVNYPAEVFVTKYNYEYVTQDESGYLGGKNMRIVDNSYEIDLISKMVSYNTQQEASYNPNRFFCNAYASYNVVTPNGTEYKITSWNVDERLRDCYYDGDVMNVITINAGQESEIVLREYYFQGARVLLADKSFVGYRLRPNSDMVAQYFKSCDDFTRAILSFDTNPIFTLSIDIPVEGNDGLYMSRRDFTWPNVDNWNPDIESASFKTYYANLSSIAEWYDNNRVDNMWRNMTHDSIKNLDGTVDDEHWMDSEEDYKIGTSHMRGFLQAVGRLFDYLKLKIDNIKYANNLSYDGNNNTPDYFLSDQLELSGWEVSSVVKTLDKSIVSDILFSGDNKRYSTSDLNILFMRILKLNSTEILNRKGTKEAIEMVLALFGLCSYDWARKWYNALSDTKKVLRNTDIVPWKMLSEDTRNNMFDYSFDELIAVASNSAEDIVDNEDALPAESYGACRKTYAEEGYDASPLMGLPVRLVRVYVEDGEGEAVMKYIVPWFDRKETYDGKTYFQMYGGWFKSMRERVEPDKELYPNTEELFTRNGFKIYDETEKYLPICPNVSELTRVPEDHIIDGSIVYVSDLIDYKDHYGTSPDSNTSHYFVLNKKDNIEDYGGDGWENIPVDEISAAPYTTVNGMRVVYLESIVESAKGNNPHVGYGMYDDGEEYLDRLRHIFKGTEAADNFTDDAYDCETGELLSGITSCGFFVRENVVDNMKCWYFSDTSKSGLYVLKQDMTDAYDSDMNQYKVNYGYSEAYAQPSVRVGKMAYNNNEVGFKSALSAFNFETQADNDIDEAAANSIINTKRVTIHFNNKYLNNKAFEDYFEQCILPYVQQVTPSTTIIDYVIPRNLVVRFVNYDGTVLQEDYMAIGETPRYEGETPQRPESTGEQYVFVGWTPEIGPIEHDMVYTAVYDDMSKYSYITFVNYDGTVLQEGYVKNGTLPVYNGDVPEKESTEYNTYTFTGWDNPIVAANGDATYTAVFEDGVRYYTIEFVNYDGSVLQSEQMIYGEFPIYSGSDPYREDDITAYYTWNGWTPEIEPVTEDATYVASYEATQKTYTVTFDSVGGGEIASQEVPFGNLVGLPDDPEKEGCTFDGWYNGVTPWDFATDRVTQDITLTAHWINDVVSYTVTFNTNGGTAVPTQIVNYGDLVVRPEEPTREGYNFVAWVDEDDNIWDFNADMVTSNMTLYAKWESQVAVVTVTFMNMGSVYQTVVVEQGSMVTPPENPERENYTFGGWVDMYGEQFNFASPVVTDTELYATWNEVLGEHTVTFMYDNETIYTTQTVTDGETAYTPAEPERENKVFVQWITSAGTPYDFTSEVHSSIVLYAEWRDETVSVTFQYSLSDATIYQVATITKGLPVPKPSDPTKAGFEFSAWTIFIGTEWDFSQPVTNDMTLYGTWIQDQDEFVVTFINGGEIYSSVTVYDGTIISKPEPDPTRVDKDFVGWSMEINNYIPFDFTEPITANTTVYSYWEDKMLTIMFTVDGVQFGEPQVIPWGTRVTEPSPAPEKEGYVFIAWQHNGTTWNFNNNALEDMVLTARFDPVRFTVTFDNTSVAPYDVMSQTVVSGNTVSRFPDEEQLFVSPGSEYELVGWREAGAMSDWDFENTPVTSDITLYSHWEIKTFTVTFMSDGQTFDTQTVNYGGKATEPYPAPTKPGYTFRFWVTTDGGLQLYDFDDQIYADTTIYASFTRDTYTVTFYQLVDNGGTIEYGVYGTRTAAYGDTVVVPPAPRQVPVGYRFNYWTLDTGTTIEFTSQTPVYGNTDVYGQYSKKVDVAFKNSADNHNIYLTTGWTGELLERPADPSPATGYVFDGWYKERACTTPWVFETDIVTGTTTVYAKFIQDTEPVPVLFVELGNPGNLLGETQGYFNDYVEQPDDPVKEGYEFVGWYSDSEGLFKWVFDTDTISERPTYIYAKFEELTRRP